MIIFFFVISNLLLISTNIFPLYFCSFHLYCFDLFYIFHTYTKHVQYFVWLFEHMKQVITILTAFSVMACFNLFAFFFFLIRDIYFSPLYAYLVSFDQMAVTMSFAPF